MRTSFYLFFVVLIGGAVFFGCSPGAEQKTSIPEKSTTPIDKAKMIIKAAIEQHGGNVYDNLHFEFDFRDRHYVAKRKLGSYQYERHFKDSTGAKIVDVLKNEGFQRFTNGQRSNISSKDSFNFSNSVNSVLYFALLPYFLDDPAVNTKYLGEIQINGTTYDKVKITFQEENGGKDFQDQFVYWFNKEENTLDFLAYNYLTDGGGARFRAAYNKRRVNQLLINDYINFKPNTKRMDVELFDSLYLNDGLKELSRIELVNEVVEME